MTRDCHHDELSSDDDVPSPEPSTFEEVLHQMPVTHAEAFTSGELPEPDPANHTSMSRPHSSLNDFVAERREDVIAAIIGFIWLEFQELFEIVHNSLHQVTPGRRMAMFRWNHFT
jgi:hypothetical protein